ncbi:MAG TPA: hypothetical protein VMJ64_04320 [Anaerolineales bacterium]|nr:hypothetical protein [Anaerolineales bacterium]
MRRGFGRPPGHRFAGDIPPLLRRANQMLSAGEYAGAANAYEQLARAAEARGGLRAPLFYVQAGRCFVMAGQSVNGLEDLERGLGLFAVRGQHGRASKIGQRIVQELKARNLQKEAQQITDYLNELVPGFGEGIPSHETAAPAERASLPTHCPGCGAPMRPDEVEWADGNTAICAYCGSPAHGET